MIAAESPPCSPLASSVALPAQAAGDLINILPRLLRTSLVAATKIWVRSCSVYLHSTYRDLELTGRQIIREIQFDYVYRYHLLFS